VTRLVEIATEVAGNLGLPVSALLAAKELEE